MSYAYVSRCRSARWAWGTGGSGRRPTNPYSTHCAGMPRRPERAASAGSVENGPANRGRREIARRSGVPAKSERRLWGGFVEWVLADSGTNVEQFREEGEVEGRAEEANPGRAARTSLVADQALDRFHVAESPELEALLDIDELLAEFVCRPLTGGLSVDCLDYRD